MEKNYKIMKAQDREQLILVKLISQDGVSLDDIVLKTGISQRTAYNDIYKVKNYLTNEYGVEIEKEGQIYSLNHKDKELLMSYGIGSDVDYIFSQPDLKYNIISYLIDNNATTLENIANHLYYSKSTIYQEMSKIEKMLMKFNLQLAMKPYYGISLIGLEKDIRFLMQYMIADQLSSVTLNIETILKSKQVIPTEFTKAIEKIKNNYPDLFDFDFLISVYVMYTRTIQGKSYVKSDEIENMFSSSIQLDEMKKLIDALEEELNMKFSQDEVYYLLMNLNSIVVEEEDSNNFNHILVEIENLLKEKHKRLDVDNSVLIPNLFIHINAMLKRWKLGKVTRNPVLSQTKEQIPYSFSISADIALMLKEKFNVLVNEEEIGLLSMHIQTILETEKQKQLDQIQVIIVSHIGYGNTILLMNQIANRFSNLKVISRLTLQQFNLMLAEDALDEDCIVISTTNIAMNSEKYILINPILGKEDYERIVSFVAEKKMYSSRERNSIISNYLHEEIIYLSSEFKGQDDLLKVVCEKMESLNYVNSEFYNSTIERERLSTTYTLNGVALPHGYSKNVIHPVISLVTLKKPISWDGHWVNTVFVCALTLTVQKNERDITEELYEIVNDKSLIESIGNSRTIQEIKKILNEKKEVKYD